MSCEKGDDHVKSALCQLYSDEVIGTLLILDVVSRAFVSATYVSYNAINRNRRRERERERERESKGESDGERWREGD